jgi:hypothetical protein
MAQRLSKHRLNGKIERLSRGVAIYKTHATPFWQARIWVPKAGRYVVRSTKETGKLNARRVADELAYDLKDPNRPAPPEFSFKHYAGRMIAKGRQLVESGERNANYIRTTQLFLDNDDWGLVRHFGQRDVRELKTRDYQLFIEGIAKKRPDLSASTRNMLMATWRNVLKAARDDGVIDAIPGTPRPKQRDNPRPFFWFAPLVAKEDDEYKKLLDGAKQLVAGKVVVRGVPVTPELYDLILFCVHSFVRPTVSELYALKHSDVTVVETDKEHRHLLLTIRKGKTGMRHTATMFGAVDVFKRIKARNPKATGEDYLFFPDYTNRATAARVVQRQFNHLLEVTGLKQDRISAKERTVYSLRHTGICMRLVLSAGKVNIFTLAKNAGTSVDQIERFYAKWLPISKELIQNLQSFGE